MKVRTGYAKILGQRACFNPRTREGANDGNLGRVIYDPVSIHAPVKVQT